MGDGVYGHVTDYGVELTYCIESRDERNTERYE